ncbi:MAG: hypothetical protein Q7U30_13755, partial [Methylicorpusculum sp.]|nr:hypothetical protein [Methylicorpusculum sp.]
MVYDVIDIALTRGCFKKGFTLTRRVIVSILSCFSYFPPLRKGLQGRMGIASFLQVRALFPNYVLTTKLSKAQQDCRQQ